MLKISRYYKPFILLILIAMIFLFAEAMCDLKLPDYMSNIVNVGIQANGIENIAPEVISENGFELMKSFMTEEEGKFFESQYIKINKEDPEYAIEYPITLEKSIYILVNEINKEDLSRLNNIFSISSNTILNLVTTMANSSNDIQYNTSQTENMDINKFYEQMPMLKMLPQEKISEAREKTLKTPENMLTSVGLVFTKAFYSEVEINMEKHQNKYIVDVGIRMLGVCVLGIVSSVLVGFLASKVGSGIGKNLRKDVFEKVQSFSSVEFNNFSVASLITRTTNDITQIQNITIMMIRMFAYAPIMGIGSLIMMSQKTTKLIWTIVLACSLIICIIIFLFKIVLPKIKIVQKLTDKINLVAKENLSGLMVVRAFGTQSYEENRFDEVNTTVMKNNKFINRSLSMMMPTMTLIMNGLTVLILWVGAESVSNATIQVGDLMAVMQYGIEVVMSFLFVSMIFIMLPRASVSANRINEVLDMGTTINNPKKSQKFNESKKGIVEFKNVSFKYPGADDYVLEKISFTAKPGQTTAIIGSTGSGKSTLVNLIPRLFDSTEGEVIVNGVNVKDVNQNELHNQIGYVLQKGSLLSGTIKSNLKYGNENASEEEIKKCAEVAQALEFIDSKEEKFDSSISQGAKNVSGGQKQRLSIARALVKNSPIYIFDDSFSALDLKTDSVLRKALKEYSKDSTFIIVAQRVSTIMNAEQIIVLDEGKIKGIGTHKELLENCDIYYEIALSQLSKEEIENGRKQ